MPNEEKIVKERSIHISTSFTTPQYQLLVKVKRDKHFLKEQDVIRAALNYYFESFGYKTV